MKSHRWFPILLAVIMSTASCGGEQKRLEKISFPVAEATMTIGEEYRLVPTFEPFIEGALHPLEWTSSAPTIASVDEDGLVKALQKGNATIVATSKENKDIFASCSFTINEPIDDSDDARVTFSSSKMTAHLYSEETTEDVDVYYREDKLKLIPHILVDDYYSLLLGETLEVKRTAIGRYELIAATGEKALLNTIANTLSCDDLENFVNTTIYRQSDVANTYFDGSPFVRVKETTVDKKATPYTIDFQKYGIDIIGQGDNVYFPLVTASNLFSGPTMITSFFTRSDIYFVDPSDKYYDTYNVISRVEYNRDINQYFPGGKREEDQAKFSYGELCFYLDTFYGLPGREYLHEEYAANRDLDKVLQEKSDLTRKAREYLLSTDQAEYLAGMMILNDLLFDAGHTVIASGTMQVCSLDKELRSKVNTKLEEASFASGEIAAKRSYDSSYLNGIFAQATADDISNNSAKLSGDTVLYTFNAFDFDMEEWKAYYRGETQMPRDALGNFKRTLSQALETDGVKNIVLDITRNGGGYADLVFTFMGLMGKEGYIHYQDMVNGNTVTTKYDLDLNLDGKFDAFDKLSYPFRFGVLCSRLSFSCGNMLPAQAKDQGIMLLGDTSGGGACAVLDSCSTEGLYVRISSPVHMMREDGSNVDFGIAPDKNLLDQSPLGYDFTSFYSLDTISKAMNEFYAEA